MPLSSPISLPPATERASPPQHLEIEAQVECSPHLPVKGAQREAACHPRMEGTDRESASTSCVREVALVALCEGSLSAACAWRVLDQRRWSGIHRVLEESGLGAFGDDVAHDLQLCRSRSHRRTDAQLVSLPLSSRTSIPTTLIPRRLSPTDDLVGIFPPTPPASADLYRFSHITPTTTSFCRDPDRLLQANSYGDSN